MNHKLSIQLVPGWLASIRLRLDFVYLTWSKVSPFCSLSSARFPSLSLTE
jgi:hypothetical protein